MSRGDPPTYSQAQSDPPPPYSEAEADPPPPYSQQYVPPPPSSQQSGTGVNVTAANPPGRNDTAWSSGVNTTNPQSNATARQRTPYSSRS